MTTAAAGGVLGMTSAAVRRRIVSGEIAGGAEPRPRRPRYYVYSDVPPLLPPRNEAGDGAEAAGLRARVQALETANLLLLAGEQHLRDAADAAARAADLLRRAEAERADEARLVRLADAAKADALSALFVPGHPGALAT